MIDCLASNFAFNIMGEQKVFDTIAGKVPYTDPDWIKVFALFADMRDAGILASGMITMINKRAELMFSSERAAMAFNGSWCVNVYHGMNPKLEYAAMLPPKVSDKYPVTIWGGAGSSFVVNEKSPNKDKAIAFLKWLTASPQQVFLAKETRNLPSNKDSLAQIPPILAGFAKHMDNTTHPNTFPAIEYPQVTEVFDKGIQAILIGEKTPEQLGREIQAEKEKQMKAQ
jgi:ABC-type glycerol-3-phosphate transport system substrate-binding protein